MAILLRIALLLLLIGIGKSAWVGEDFWTTIHDNGKIEEGRSFDDFIHLKVIRADLNVEAFIGFWIQKDPDGRHHESFGHVFLSGSRICGRFLARDHNKTELICGGFRILSRELRDYTSPFYFISSRIAQPYDSVGYRRMQIARIWIDENHTASVFGGVSLSQRTAYGIFPNGTTLNIDYSSDPAAYVKQVEVLHMEREAMNKVRERRKQRKAMREANRHHYRHHKRHLKHSTKTESNAVENLDLLNFDSFEES